MADEPRNREIVEAGYDDVADRYAELEAAGHEWPRMRWLAKLLAQIEPGRAVLDVGCGNGVPAARLRPSGWLLLSIEPEAEPGNVRDWLATRCSSASTTRR
jgi:predicted TPR repeat methyltransferase